MKVLITLGEKFGNLLAVSLVILYVPYPTVVT